MRQQVFTLVLVLSLVGIWAHQLHTREVFLRESNIDTRSSNTFDKDPAYTARLNLRKDADTREQYLVHVRGPVTSDLRKNIESYLGCELGYYIPHNTFILVATHDVAEAAKSAPGVLWVGAFHPEYKFNSNFDADARDISVTLHSEFSDSELSSLVSSWSNEFKANIEISDLSHVVLHLSPKSNAFQVAQQLADQASVHWVEAMYPMFSHAANYSATGVVESGSSAPASALRNAGITGKGTNVQEIVSVADSGLDWQNCFFGQTQTPPDNAPANYTLKVVKYITKYANSQDETGHGTGVAGLAAGKATGTGDSRLNGIAPEAKLYITDLGLGDAPLRVPANITSFLAEPYNETVRVFVNAFGTNSHTYDAASQTIDNFVVRNPDALIIWSAGNSGYNGSSSVGSPALAKNVLTVGATLDSYSAIFENANNALKEKIALNPSLYNNNIVAGFGSRGPTFDGRFKPDIVAPGAFVNAPAPSLETNRCARNTSVFGTSYSAGLVGGAAALVRQYLRQGFIDGAANPSLQIPNPSAALVKATLINSGVAATGRQGRDGLFYALPGTIPNPEYGFGQVKLSNVLYTNTGNWGSKSFFEDDREGLATGQIHKYCFAAKSTGGGLSATLVWTDAASTPAAGIALVNNLDLLVVDSNGVQYRANGLSEFDALNNVERVITPSSPATTTYSIFVYGTNVPVGLAQGTVKQPYALVVSGNVVRGGPCPTLCPSACSGRGSCVNGTCQCPTGFSGIDCSVSPCPHNCQALDGAINGHCNYETGVCTCGPAFSGPDCRAPFNPPPPPVDKVRHGIPVGTAVALICAVFVLGGCFCGVIAWYIAVKYVEHKRKGDF